MPSLTAQRHAPWSMSKVQCALRCPQEFHFRYIERISEPEVSAAQRIGKAVHATLEHVLLRHAVDESLATGRNLLLLPEEQERFDTLAPGVRAFRERIEAFREKRRPRHEMVEQQLAVDAALRPTLFVAPEAFFRGIVDAGFEWGEGEIAVVDHKTGMRRLITDYSDQLEAYAALIVLAQPQARKVWLGVHFVGPAAMEWAPPVTAEYVRGEALPRLLELIEQAARAVTPMVPRPGNYCAWCSYRSLCPAMRNQPVPEPVVDVAFEVESPQPPEGED